MRKVFSSQRLENVETVAGMLRAEGIEVRITGDRSYHGKRRRPFSYREREEPEPQPAVWILRAEDQPRGRQLLREAGLLDSSRADSSYVPLSALGPRKAARPMQVKLGLLLAIVVVIGLIVFGVRLQGPTTPAPAVSMPRVAMLPQASGEPVAYRADVPTALAKLLLEGELAARGQRPACIAIDGGDPAPAFLQALAAPGATVQPASACPPGGVRIEVRDYTTDGSGTGSVRTQVGKDPARVVHVERDGTRWRILDGPG